jgi:FlaA1/EpsC-like NDP-sugar epimerase
MISSEQTNMIKEYPDWVLLLRGKILNLFSKYSVPRWLVFVTDNIAVFIAFVFAYLLRFNFETTAFNHAIAINHALIALSVYIVYSIVFRSYSGLLRHTTLTDISLVFLVTTISLTTLLIFSFCSRSFRWGNHMDIPISIILIHYVCITVGLFFERVIVKVVFRFATSSSRNTRNVLIHGAGELGFVVKRVILSDPKYGFYVKGFIDTDKNLHGKKINGIPVYSDSALSHDFILKNKIESLIIAQNEITIEAKSKIIRTAINLGLEVLETPEVDKWLNGQLNTRHFQRVKLEDLLGRDPIKLNLDSIRKGLHDRTILITGAAGSIGSEIARQLARFNSRSVILVDQAETPLFYLENEFKEKYKDLHIQVVLADVTNLAKMDVIFHKYTPDIIFHAAAYKHVSLLEENPYEAMRVNVGGTKVLTELAIKYKVGKFVMISTDKSVNPTSVMGASKRICEKVVQARSMTKDNSTQFIITRFGNVLGSNGSVIPLFSKQIQNGGPVTVTHPEIYRYFMTIPEACQLVLEAGFMGNGGEIFVFDMGDPVKIADLATNMILLSGLVPGKDIKIVYTGLRPGEKLYEELLTNNETVLTTHHPKIKKARVENIEGKALMNIIDYFLVNLYTLSRQDVIKIMMELVPEYVSSNVLYNGSVKNIEN